MYKENKCLPYLYLEDGQYIFIGNIKDPVRHDEICEVEDKSFQIILPIESILDENYLTQKALLNIVNLIVLSVILEI